MLSEAKKKYLELEMKKQEYKIFMEEFKMAVIELQEEIGVGGHFQDNMGTVYQVADATGRFVHFDRYEIKRTRREGERSGNLSLTVARDLGYEVK